MNSVSYSIATANPIASANPGEGMVSMESSCQTAMRDGAVCKGKRQRCVRRVGDGREPRPSTRIEVENKVGFLVNLNLIAGQLAEGAGLDHGG